MPAHKLNAVSGVGRQALALKPYAVPGDLPAIAVCAGIAVVQRPWLWQAGGRRGMLDTK